MSGSLSIKKGIKLILYGMSKLLKIKPFFLNDLYNETNEYAIRCVKLSKMLGLKTIVGIKDTLEKDELINKLKEIDKDIDLRKHIHIGDNKDKDRLRIWIPPLNQSKYIYQFENEYVKNNKPKLLVTDIVGFHFDCPDHIYYLIDYLYNRYINNNDDITIVKEYEGDAK